MCLTDEMEDAELLAIAIERMAHFDPAATIPMEEMNRRLGITEADLEGFEAIEFE